MLTVSGLMVLAIWMLLHMYLFLFVLLVGFSLFLRLRFSATDLTSVVRDNTLLHTGGHPPPFLLPDASNVGLPGAKN